MQCLFDCIAKGTGNFSLLSVQSDSDSINRNHLTAFQVEKQKNMSTNCDDHCISCVSGDKEQKYKKWHVFSGNPILLHKGTAEKKTVPQWLPASNQKRSEATMQKNKKQKKNANEV